MTKYSVPVTMDSSGFITVDANSKEEALEKARERWSRKGQKAMEMPCVDVDFAYGDDLNSIEEEEEVTHEERLNRR